MSSVWITWLACTGSDPGKGPSGDDPPVDTGNPSDGPSSADAEIVITEVMASNASGLQDDGGAFPDWVELYNAGDEDLDLAGFSLTDEQDWVDQWVFGPDVVIPAGGYLVVFADGDESEGPLHASFKLSGLGEYVGLYGREIDGHPYLDYVDFPAQTTDVSWARSGDAWGFDDTPTPGAENG